MSIIKINYGELNDAAKDAGKTAGKLRDYASRLDDKISGPLSRYRGDSSGYLSSASASIKTKRDNLETSASEFDRFSGRLYDLVDSAKAADTNVSNKVSSLTGSFKKRHNIEINPLVEALCFLKNSIFGSTDIGRFFDNLGRRIGDALDGFANRVSQWYKYEGGKYMLEALKDILLVVAAVVLLVAAAFVFFPGLIAVITGAAAMSFAVVAEGAALILAAIAVGDAMVDLEYSSRAAGQDDPVKAYRLNEIDSMSESLRTSYNSSDHTWATVIDATSIVCSVISVVNLGKTALTKGWGWLNGGNKVNFNWSNLKSAASAKWGNFTQGFQNFRLNFSTQGFSAIKDVASNLGNSFKTNLISNLNDIFKPINTADTYKNLQNGGKNVKYVTNGFKTLLEDGPLGLIKDNVLFDLGLSSIALDSGLESKPDLVSIDDIRSILEKSFKQGGKIGDLFSGNNYSQPYGAYGRATAQ